MSYPGYGAPGGYPPHGGAPQGYPPQQGGYPPQQGGYPGSPQGFPPQQHGTPQGFPPQQGGYPPQGAPGGYPPQQPGSTSGSKPSSSSSSTPSSSSTGSYPPQGAPGGYPPQQGGSYPPQGGAYGQPPSSSTSSGSYPPQGAPGGYPPQQGGSYPPQQGSYPPQGAPGGYPPQQGGYPGSQGSYGQPGGYQPAPTGLAPGAKPPSSSVYGAPPQDLGWGAQYYNQINTNQMNDLQSTFQRADNDRSGKISTAELANIPIAGNRIGEYNAKVLMKVFDKDNSGQIDFFEFATLHQFITKMTEAFTRADADRSGTLDPREIHAAISAAGFQVGPQTVQEICALNASSNSGSVLPGSSQGVRMDQFVSICARLAAIRSIFEWNDQQRTGRVNFTYEQLAQIVFNQANQ